MNRRLSSLIPLAVFSALLSCGPSDTVPQPKPQPVFDVPSLIGKDIDEIRQILGKPTDERLTEPPPETIKKFDDEWDNRFSKNGYKLLVVFSPKTRQVVDFFFPTNDPSQKTRDVQSLMHLTGVSEMDSLYTVERVPVQGSPSEYTGIIITKK